MLKECNKFRPEGYSICSPDNRYFSTTEEGLEEAGRTGRILEAMAVRCDSDYNLTVDLGCMKGIIPKEEVTYNGDLPVRDIAVITRVGKAVCFQVIGFRRENGKKYALLSRRSAQRICQEQYLCDLIPGDIIDAKITHMEKFGAFADIGCGVISLLTIDCISVSRISHPADRFRIGDRIRVAVRSNDSEKRRIYITHKELLGTWEENTSLFRIGQTVVGIVRSIEAYGVFVELTPNLAGLAEYREGISVGQTVGVFIKNIQPERMKVKLVIIDSYNGEMQPSCRPESQNASLLHIDRFRYSPAASQRVIETVFR